MTDQRDLDRWLFAADRPLFVMAGPCVIESEETTLETAAGLREICSRVGFPLIFKSSYDKGNRMLLHIKDLC